MTNQEITELTDEWAETRLMVASKELGGNGDGWDADLPEAYTTYHEYIGWIMGIDPPINIDPIPTRYCSTASEVAAAATRMQYPQDPGEGRGAVNTLLIWKNSQ